jgi:hypothetical protein
MEFEKIIYSAYHTLCQKRSRYGPLPDAQGLPGHAVPACGFKSQVL